ncbi:HTH-type transcriptional regulator (plasmid) [Streptomyces xanthophaeus]|uniref:helix-turn-helix domain-containing protein n=1 Tax=Streptomyces xanthophaeus TaxID=67385 RepID=UPI00233F25B6|nr:helix-turn-helix domain-containing protein [Streptomyces xanthophaeus]WCD91385.1 HTH-type transcriptional regulator [Streptomyces xanthophaeus]
MEHLVQHAVTTIRERFGEPLTLDELACTAMVSKYHFLRMFTRVTGVTPGRFLTAVRLQEAKRLLLSTSLNVADVSAQVGYSSTGSFTRRFTESVGLSPTQYRKLSLGAREETQEPEPSEAAPAADGTADRRTGSVTGVVRTAGSVRSPIYVGAFDSPILQGAPASWSNASAPGRFTLPRIPTGTWYIHAVARGSHPDSAAAPGPTQLIATVGPVPVKGDTASHLDIALSPLDWTRPPILSALVGLEAQPLAA